MPIYLIDIIAWLYIEDRRLLSTLEWGKKVYYRPGDKREGSETDQETLTRVVAEFLDVRLLPETIRYLSTFEYVTEIRSGTQIVRMICYSADYVGEMKLTNRVAVIGWLTHDEWWKCSPSDRQIFEWLHEQGLID